MPCSCPSYLLVRCWWDDLLRLWAHDQVACAQLEVEAEEEVEVGVVEMDVAVVLLLLALLQHASARSSRGASITSVCSSNARDTCPSTMWRWTSASTF